MQRPTESCSTSMRQPAPASFGPPMMQSSGTNTSLPLDGAVLERHVQREVAPADRDPGGVARDERAGDANVRLLAHELVGVEHAECEADHGGHGGKGDVALVEVQPQPQHLAALPGTAADDAGVRDRAGVGAGARPGEGEARHLLPARQARQVVVLLLLGAVVVEQLRGPEGVGHRDGGGAGGAAAGDQRQHARVGVGGELKPAVLLRDDHGEEATALEEIPHLQAAGPRARA